MIYKNESSQHFWSDHCLNSLIYFIPVKWKQLFCLLLSLALSIITTVWAIESFGGEIVVQRLSMPFWFHSSLLEIDKLSAFFLIVINFGSLTSILYSRGYLKMYESKASQDFSLHYFFLIWLQIAMVLVVSLHEGLPFLVAWEIMSISSFMLVIFESEKKEILNTVFTTLFKCMWLCFLYWLLLHWWRRRQVSPVLMDL